VADLLINWIANFASLKRAEFLVAAASQIKIGGHIGIPPSDAAAVRAITLMNARGAATGSEKISGNELAYSASHVDINVSVSRDR